MGPGGGSYRVWAGCYCAGWEKFIREIVMHGRIYYKVMLILYIPVIRGRVNVMLKLK